MYIEHKWVHAPARKSLRPDAEGTKQTFEQTSSDAPLCLNSFPR